MGDMLSRLIRRLFGRRERSQIISPEEIKALELRYVPGPDGAQDIALVDPETGEIKYRDLKIRREDLDRFCREYVAAAEEVAREERG